MNDSLKKNQVYKELLGQIRRGVLAPGEQLPGEAQLAVSLHVSRGTLRAALDLLEEEKWELKPAAERCGISATALVKRLARDPELWSFANHERQRFGHCPLRKP